MSNAPTTHNRLDRWNTSSTSYAVRIFHPRIKRLWREQKDTWVASSKTAVVDLSRESKISTLSAGFKAVRIIPIINTAFLASDGSPVFIQTGVELDDGTKIPANKKFILAAGAYRTPQILMLSGIGPSFTLSKHGIPLVHDSPEVGQNLHDHFMFPVYFAFRLRDPSQGYAFGSNHAAWQNPAWFKYLPWDWVVSEPLPRDLLLKHGLSSSSSQPEKEEEEEPRTLYEVITLYIPPGIPGIPMDGTQIAKSTIFLRPTSRGQVSIRSRNPSDNPLIQSGYLQTELDKITLIHGARQTLRAFLSTDAMGSITESEAPPQIPGLEGTLLLSLKADSSDDEIEKRVKMTGSQHHHSGGTAAMGQVVDSCGRVMGVSRLSVVDASIVPIPLGGHPQATLYAVVEQLAHFIIISHEE